MCSTTLLDELISEEKGFSIIDELPPSKSVNSTELDPQN